MSRSTGLPARRSGMPSRALVVDANILVRAVLGKRVRELIDAYAQKGRSLFRKLHTPRPKNTWRRSSSSAAVILKRGSHSCAPWVSLMELIGSEVYGEFEAEARERLGQRDPEDWLMLAAALALGCPIWTEDTDFFGCGVATWTSDRVRMFLRE